MKVAVTVTAYVCDTPKKYNRVSQYANYHNLKHRRVATTNGGKLVILYNDDYKKWDDVKTVNLTEHVGYTGNYYYTED